MPFLDILIDIFFHKKIEITVSIYFICDQNAAQQLFLLIYFNFIYPRNRNVGEFREFCPLTDDISVIKISKFLFPEGSFKNDITAKMPRFPSSQCHR